MLGQFPIAAIAMVAQKPKLVVDIEYKWQVDQNYVQHVLKGSKMISSNPKYSQILQAGLPTLLTTLWKTTVTHGNGDGYFLSETDCLN